MSRYRYGRSGNTASDKVEKSRTAIKVTILTLVLLIPAVIYVIISTLPPSPVSGRSINKGRFDPSVTFTTDWFTFTVPNNWEEASDLHKPNQYYIFREKNGADTTGLVTVYINKPTMYYIDYFTRVFPVAVVDGNSLEPGELQPHCKTVFTKDQKITPTIVTQAEVEFKCWPDGANFYAVAGEIGGDTAISMTRKNGDKADYLITYTNTAFTPYESSFEKVLKTFQAL